MKVLAVPAVHEYLEELVIVLYEKGYFGFEGYAIDYVHDVINFITTKLPTSIHRNAPKHYDKYGKKLKYTAYRRSKTHIGTYFSTSTKPKGKSFTWCATLGTTIQMRHFLTFD